MEREKTEEGPLSPKGERKKSGFQLSRNFRLVQLNEIMIWKEKRKTNKSRSDATYICILRSQPCKTELIDRN